MKKSRYTAAACCGMLASASLPLEAGAQQQQASAQSGTALEEVIVTAQKRAQRLQDVASSVSVVDATTIADAGVSQIDDIVLLTPGLDFSQTLGRQNTHPLIRGVAPQFLTDPTVIVFVTASRSASRAWSITRCCRIWSASRSSRDRRRRCTDEMRSVE